MPGERDPAVGVVGADLDPDVDGVGCDVWGNQWPLGGRVSARPAELLSAAPDNPTDLTGIEAMPPGPALAGLLAQLSPADVSDRDLVEVIAAAERMTRWASAVQATAVAELSRRPVFTPDRARSPRDELRSAGAQIAVELRLAPTTGEQRSWTARTLVEELPATLAAMRAGAIDYRRAAALADLVASHDGPTARAVEARVLDRAGRRTIGQHRAAIDRALLQVAPHTAEQRHAAAAAGRRVVHYPTADGMADTVATLTADAMATLRAAIDAAAAGMRAANPADTRTLDQLRADALTEMARLSLATGWLAGVEAADGVRLATAHRRRPQIQVTVPYSTLIGIDDHPGDLAGYGPIPTSVARRIAADGVWRRLLTDPATGRLLDYGTTTYQPPADLREYVIARDRTCVFPGCRQPARRCQIDHTIRYPHGPTAKSNTAPLDRSHHILKTHFGWQLDQPMEGEFTWTSPTGKTYTSDPEPIGPILTGPGPAPTTSDPDPPDESPF